MPRSKDSDDWRDQFYRYLQDKGNSAAKDSLEYLTKNGCPEDALLNMLETFVHLDRITPQTRGKALERWGLTPKQIKTRVKQLQEIADLMGKLDRQDWLGGGGHFGSFQHTLRQATEALRTWKPSTLNPRSWLLSLIVTHFVKLAVPSAPYRHIANVLHAAYACAGVRAPLTDDETLARYYRRHRRLLSSPDLEGRLRSRLSRR